MKINQPHTNIVCHVPRYGSTAPSPEVLEAARKLLEKKGVVLKENEGVETYSSVGEAIVCNNGGNIPRELFSELIFF